MADNFLVLDVRVDELAANLNAIQEPYQIVSQDYYTLGEVRRVTVLLGRLVPIAANLPPGFDPRKLSRN